MSIEKVKEDEPKTSIWSNKIEGSETVFKSSIANRNVLLPPSAVAVLSILLKTSVKVDPSVAEGVYPEFSVSKSIVVVCPNPIWVKQTSAIKLKIVLKFMKCEVVLLELVGVFIAIV